jgi:excisionase family DNA binding protein
MTVSLPVIYTPEEVQAYLKIGRSKFYELIQLTKLDHIRSGREIRVTEEQLKKYIRENTVTG